MPDVPTIMESGFQDFEVTVWQGYAVPKGTPQPIVAKIHAATMKALALPELEKRFFDAGVSAVPQTPAEFVKFVNAETAKWQKVVTDAGVKLV